MKNPLLLLVVVISAAVLPAQAEPIKVDMKAGLWENTMKWDAGSAKEMQAMQTDQMKERYANMPVEDRQQIEAIMAQSGMEFKEDGFTVNNDQIKISSSGSTVKSCITQAEIDRGELPDNVEGCTSTLKKISATRFTSTHVCEGESQSRGQTDITFHSPKHYTGVGKMTQVLNGKAHNMSFKMEGKWLSGDCGNSKPD